MRFWLLNMTFLKVKEGHFFGDCRFSLFFTIFFLLLLRLKVFRSITLNIFMIQTLSKVMQLFKVSEHSFGSL